MGGVLDQGLALRKPRDLVVGGVSPGVVGVGRARRGRDDLPQVEPDLRQQSVLVQVGQEALAVRQGQAPFATRPPAERERGRIPSRNGRDDDQTGHRLKAHAGDSFVRVRILPGPKPVDPGCIQATVRLDDARLRRSPAGRTLLVWRPPWAGLAMRDRLEAVLTPTALKGADLMAPADRDTFLRSIGVEHDIIGGVFAKLSLTAHRRNDPAGTGLRGPQIRGVHKDEPWGGRGSKLDGYGLARDGHSIADLKGDAPRDAGAARCVVEGVVHLAGNPGIG